MQEIMMQAVAPKLTFARWVSPKGEGRIYVNGLPYQGAKVFIVRDKDCQDRRPGACRLIVTGGYAPDRAMLGMDAESEIRIQCGFDIAAAGAAEKLLKLSK